MEDLKWDQLTVNELKQVLADAEVSCPANIYRKKSQLVELCSDAFGNGKALYDALSRFNRFSKPKASSHSKTPSRTRQPQGRLSIPYVQHDSSTKMVTKTQQDHEIDRPLPTTPTNRPRSTRTSVSPVQNSALRSLMASNAANQEFHKELFQRHRTPVRSSDSVGIRPISKTTQDPSLSKSIVRAGRFSFSSEDIVLSPTYHTANSPPDQSTRGSPKHSERISRASSYRHESPVCSLGYNWPALDPQGNRIRWRIRDPFIFNLEDTETTHSGGEGKSAPCCTKPPQQTLHKAKKQPKQLQYRLTRILFCMALVFLLVSFLGPSAFLASFFTPSRLKTLYSPVKNFCDAETRQNTSMSCVPCPENSICHGTRFECQRPQYRKEKHKGKWMCVKDQKTYRQAHALLKTISVLLAEAQGNVSCGQPYPEDAVVLNNTVTLNILLTKDRFPRIGFTREALEKRLDAIAHGQKDIHQQLYHLVFTEVFRTFHQTLPYTVRSQWITRSTRGKSTLLNSNETLVYFTLHPKLPWKCWLKRLAFQWGLPLVLLWILVIFTWQKHKSKQSNKMLCDAIARIITEQTSTQKIPGGKGYAIGPRASDLHHILLYGKAPEFSSMDPERVHYSEYTAKPFTRGLDLHRVQSLCEDLVKHNEDFCRSVLYVDRIPFYFNKRVIDRSRLNAQPVNNQPTKISF